MLIDAEIHGSIENIHKKWYPRVTILKQNAMNCESAKINI